MFKQYLMALVLAIYVAPLFAEQLGPTADNAGGTIDLEPPVIAHDPISGSLKANQPLVLQVRITDDHGVFSATLFYRNSGAKEFRSLAMRLSETDNDVYVIEIPGQDISPPKLEYYIQATDVSGNTVLRGGRLFPLSAAVESDFIPLAGTTAVAATTDDSKGLKLNDQSKSKYTWAWIAGGALLGALVAINNGKDDGGGTPPTAKPNGALVITFPNPNPPQ